jgi:hypothetical protein
VCEIERATQRVCVLTSSMGVWEGLLRVKSSGYTVPLHCVFTDEWAGFSAQSVCLGAGSAVANSSQGGDRTVTVDWVRYHSVCL